MSVDNIAFCEDGYLVLYSDYKKLERELTEMEKDKAVLVEALKQIKMAAHDIYQLTGDSDLQMMLDDLRDIADAAIDQREGVKCTCGNVGFNVVPDCAGQPDMKQCEFCYTTPQSEFNRIALLKQHGGEQS
jgi:DUF1680 family protein